MRSVMKLARVAAVAAVAIVLGACAGSSPRENYEALLRAEAAGLQAFLLADPQACTPVVPLPEPTDPALRLMWLEERVVYLRCLIAADGDPAKCAACEPRALPDT